MHVAVTGAAGMIGRKLTDRLVADGHLGGVGLDPLHLTFPIHPLRLLVAPEICESDIPTFFAYAPRTEAAFSLRPTEGFPCAGSPSTAANPQGESGGVAASLRRMILREWVKDNRSGSMFWCSAASFIKVRTARWASIKP